MCCEAASDLYHASQGDAAKRERTGFLNPAFRILVLISGVLFGCQRAAAAALRFNETAACSGFNETLRLMRRACDQALNETRRCAGLILLERCAAFISQCPSPGRWVCVGSRGRRGGIITLRFNNQ